MENEVDETTKEVYIENNGISKQTTTAIDNGYRLNSHRIKRTMRSYN